MSAIPRTAHILGWAGVIPFAVTAAMTFMYEGVAAGMAATWLVIYGGIILSFMGGAQWGIAMRPNQAASEPSGEVDHPRLMISVIPALVGFAAILLASHQGIWLLCAGFIGLLAYDISTVKAGQAPAWYRSLRLQLTSAVLICLVLSAIAGNG